MRVAIKKLDVADIGDLQALVIANIQGIEPGLTVLDSRLLLGHATMDVVAMDANASLVLVALGFSADEEMLLKAVEAYSWCLEYPEAIRRLYPAAHVSESRPPRMIFVVGRVPDAFHRKIKQLGFQEVDCVEFRHLAVDGTPVLYFETLMRLRRPALGESDARAAAAEPVARTVPANGHVNGLQGGIHKGRPSEPAVDVPVAAAPLAVEEATVVGEPLTVMASTLPAPLVMEEPAVPVMPLPQASGPSEEAAAAVPSMEPLLSLLDQMSATGPASPTSKPMPVAEAPAPSVMPTLEVPELVLESGPDPLPSPEPAGGSIAEAARELLGAKSIEEAARAAFAAATPRQQAPAPPDAAAPPAPATPAPEKTQAQTEAAKQAAPLPQEFAGLNFPNDGVLTRQWMEFLNRMANSK